MKRVLSITIAIVMMMSSFCAIPVDSYAASKTYAVDKLESIQKKSGYVPGKTAKVKGNCYQFIAKVCEELYGVSYDGEGLYGNYRARHNTGNYYTVATLTTGSANKSNLKELIAFFVKYGASGDVVHFGKKTSSNSNNNTHTIMIQSVDTEKMVIYHSNYPYGNHSKNDCHTDTIYWDSLISSPNSNTSNSFNRIFSSVMNNGGMGVSINRYSGYTDKYVLENAGTVTPTVTGASANSVKVAWTKLENVAKYKVEYKEKGASGYKTATSKATGSSYTVSGLTVGKTYYFRVTAYFQSEWMKASSAVKKQVLPVAVTSVKSSVVNDGIKFTFKKQIDGTSIKVYRSTSKNGSYSLIKTLSKNTASFVDSNIEYGKTYYYKFQSTITKSSKTYTKNTSVYSAKYVLPTPTVSISRLSSTSINATIKSDGTQDSFCYYLKDSQGKTVFKKSYSTNGKVSLTGLTVGESYDLYCANFNSFGTGKFTKYNFKMLPLAPSSVSASISAKGATVTFSAVNNADGYYIYRSTASGSGYTKIATATSAGSYFDSTAKYNTTYYYKVKAYETVGDTKVAGIFSSATKGVCYSLEKVSDITITPTSDTGVKLSWNKCKNATKYYVEFKTKNGSWKRYDTVTTNSVNIENLKTGTTYYYRVMSATNVYNGLWVTSDANTMLPPDPSNQKITVAKNGLKISWSNKNYYDGYKIYRATSKNGRYSLVKTVSNKYTSSYTDKKAVYGTTYYYKVVGYVTKSDKTYNSRGATIKNKKYALSTPKITVSKSSSTKVKVSWNEITGATKYYVQYKISGGSYKTVTTSSLSKSVSGLKKGNKYYFRVKAVNSDGSSSYCSAKSIQL